MTTHRIKVTYRGNRPVLMVAECSCGSFKSDEGWTTQAQARQEGIMHLQSVIERMETERVADHNAIMSLADTVNVEREKVRKQQSERVEAASKFQEALDARDAENDSLKEDIITWQEANSNLQNFLNSTQNANIILQHVMEGLQEDINRYQVANNEMDALRAELAEMKKCAEGDCDH